MQTTNMYVIRDGVAEAYLAPFFFDNDLMAIRAFASLINTEGHLFGDSPQDFHLYRVGTFDVHDGGFVVDEPIQVIRGGLTLVKTEYNPAQETLFSEKQAQS